MPSLTMLLPLESTAYLICTVISIVDRFAVLLLSINLWFFFLFFVHTLTEGVSQI